MPSKYFINKNKNIFLDSDIWCIVLHPVEYQIPFYEELYKDSKGKSIVLFMDDLTTKPFRVSEWGKENVLKVRTSNLPKNFKFKYFFCKNFSLWKELLFLNRVNPGIILNIIKYQPKLVILTSYTSFTNFCILLISHLLKTKVCLRAEGGLKGREFLKNRKGFIRTNIDKLINKADYIFYSCEDNKNYFLVRGITQNKLLPILSSVETKFFSKIEYKSKKSYPYFFMASKLEERKNILEAINGFKRYLRFKKEKKIKLLIAGIGPEYEIIRKNCNENIITLGYVDDKFEIRKLIQLSLGVILSSLYDPSPKIINESIACFKPVLCRNTVGTTGDLVEHLKTGYIYNPKIDKDMIDGLDWIESNCKNKDLISHCKKKSKIWSPKQNSQSVLKLYKRIKN